MNYAIKDAVRLSDDGDKWGTTVGALFSLAETMTLRDIEVPAELEYRPSPLLNEESTRSEGYLTGELLDLYDDGEVSDGDLRHAARVLNRAADILRAQGRDY